MLLCNNVLISKLENTLYRVKILLKIIIKLNPSYYYRYRISIMSHMTDTFWHTAEKPFEGQIYVTKELKINISILSIPKANLLYISIRSGGHWSISFEIVKNPVLLMQAFYLFERIQPLGINFDKRAEGSSHFKNVSVSISP